MKLVETFLFSEEFEKELLLIKLILSNNCIDEWIICENSFSFQGEFKGSLGSYVINNDERFAPYRNKIKIITGEKHFIVHGENKVKESYTFQSEEWQRQLAYDYFINNYENNDWLIIHDVDEMFDFIDKQRKDEFFSNLSSNTNGFLCAPRQRYWFDFDNKFDILYGSPLCTKSYLLANQQVSLANIRRLISAMPVNSWNNIVAFEYSSCYSKENVLRKINTFAHAGISESDLLRSLRCNHRTIGSEALKDFLRPDKRNFMETVVLNKENSPALIRENLNSFKTHNIDVNYRQNRKKEYPQFYNYFSLTYIKMADFVKLKKKKYVKRLKKVFQ